MPISIDQLLNEADEILEKRASVVAPTIDSEDDVIKLANFLMKEDEELKPRPTSNLQEKVANVSSMVDVTQAMFEKIAESIAIVETLENIVTLTKEAEFTKKAKEAGHSDTDIENHLLKISSVRSGASKLIAPAVASVLAASAAGVAGHKSGKSKGEQAGYVKALKDVDDAFKMYNQ